MKDEQLTIQQAASFLGVSTKTLRRWEAKGHLKPSRTVGNQRRYSKESLLALLHGEKKNTAASSESSRQTTPTENTPTPIGNIPTASAPANPDFATTPQTPVTPLTSSQESSQQQFGQPGQSWTTWTSEANLEENKAKNSPVVDIMPHDSSLNPSRNAIKGLFISGALVAIALVIGVGALIAGNHHVKSLFGKTLAFLTGPANSRQQAKTTGKSVLAATDQTPQFEMEVNLPSVFAKPATFLDTVAIKKDLTVDGKLTAPNVVYSIHAGSNITISGDKQNPTISAGTTGVSSFQGQTGAVTLAQGSGISLNGLTINNTGVLSVQGTTGAVTFTGGSGITVSGTTITNTDTGTAQNIFKTITAGGTDIVAGSNNDQLTFAAGSGITVTGDAGSKTITITGSGGELSGLTTNGVLYATSSTTAGSVVGTTGTVLHGITAGAPVFSAVDLTADVTGILPVGNGGTGIGTTPTNGQLLIGNGSGYALATITQGSGIGVANGSGSITLSNTGVTSTVAGSGIGVSGATGAVTITNNGVLSLTGTANQVTVSGSTGAVTLSLPQNIATASTPTFASLTLGASTNQLVLGTGNTATITTATLTSGHTYTLPDGSGTFCLVELNNCTGSGGGGIGGSGSTHFIPVFTSATAIGDSDIYDSGGKVVIGTTSPQGLFSVSGGAAGQALVSLNNTATDQNILVGSASGATKFVFDSNGNLNLIGGTYQLGGTNLFTDSSTLATNVVTSSLTTVGALNAGSVTNGFGNIDTGGNITAEGTTGFSTTGTNAGLTFATGTGNHIISASSGTLELGAATLAGDITGNSKNVTGLNNLAAGGSITFGGFTTANGLLYTNGLGVLAQSNAGTSGQVLLSNGGTPTFTSLSGDVASVTGTGVVALKNVGTAGTYGSANQVPVLTTDAQGRVTGVVNTSIAIDASAITSGTLGTVRGGTGADLSGAAQYSIPYFSAAGVLGGALAPSTDGFVLATHSTGSAPTWVNASSLGTNYWSRTSGVLSPVTANDVLAATSSATTVGTFTTNNPAGTLTNNTLIQQTGAGTVTNLLNLTQSAGTVTTAISVNGTVGNVLKVGSNAILDGSGILQSAGLSGTYSQALTLSNASNAFTGTYNGNTITTGTGTLTLGAGKTLTVNGSTTLADNSIAFGGTESLTLTAGKNINFADAFTTSGANPLTLTTTGSTNVTLPTTGTLATLAGSEALTNKTVNGLTLTSNADGFSIAGGTASRTLTVSGSNVSLNQSLLTSSSPSFTGLTVSGLTTGIVTNTSGTLASSAHLSASLGGTGIDTSSSTGVPYISSGTWSVDANALAATHGGTGLTGYAVGDLLYADSTTTLAKRTIGSDGQILTVSGGVPVWSSAGGSINFWQENAGALAPLKITDDLLLGSTATSSAKFAFENVAGGTPTASISANTANNYTYITGDGTLATTDKQTLTLGSSSTGNIVVNGIGTGVVQATNGILSTGVVTNAELQNNSVTVTAGSGLSGGGAVALGSSITLTNAGVTSALAGTGISLSGGTGAVTITNAGVTSLVGGSGGSSTLNGALTITNSVSSGSTVTLDKATTTTLGIASFSSSNFSVSTGAVSIATGGVGPTELANTAVTANTYGGAGNGVGQFTVDADGRLTAASNRAIDLGTADITGTLGVGHGGTGTATAFTQGSLVFAGASGTYSQDNTNLFYDATKALLGIGTNTPVSRLDVEGAIAGKALSIFNYTGTDQNIFVASTSGTEKFAVNNNGNVQFTGNSGFLNTLSTTGTFSSGQTYSFPNAGGEVCVKDAGNCFGSGGGITGSGTAGQLAFFNTGSSLASDATLSFDSTHKLFGVGTNSPAATLQVNGAYGSNAAAIINQLNSGNILSASASGTTEFTINNTGSLQFTGGSGTLQTLNVATTSNVNTYTIPDAGGATDTFCLKNLGNCFGGGGGGITGSGTATQLAFFTGAGTIGSDATLSFDNTNKLFGIGNASPVGKLDLSGKVTGKALAIFNETGNQAIFTASASGTPEFTIGHDGTLTSGKYTGSNGILYANSSGVITQSNDAGASGQILLSNSGTPTFTALGGDIASVSNTGVVALKNVGTAGTYGSASQVPVLTTDAQGRVTGVTNTSIAIAASQITSGTLGAVRGGTGADLSGASQYSVPYFSAAGVLGGALAPGTDGFVLTTHGASSAPTWVDASSLGTNFWSRVAGALSPATANDVIAATSSATTVGTFTTNNPAGTLTNNTLIQQTGAGTVTNLLNLTQSAGTVTNAIAVSGTVGNVLKVGSNVILDGSGILQSAGLSGTYSNALTLSNSSNSITAGTLTATGGTLDNVAIGSTTRSTAKVTTLDANGTVTFSNATYTAGGLLKAAAGTGQLSIAAAGTDYQVPLTFNNGLTNTSNTVQLGGSLTQATNVSFGNFGLTLGDTTGTGNLTVSPNAGGQAALIVNKQGANDIFTASDSGATKFTIASDGSLTDAKYIGTNGVLYANTSGVISQSNNAGASGQILLSNSGTPTFTALGGDIASVTGAGVVALKNVGTAGTYGSASQVPVLTTDAQGRVTGVTNTSIAIAASQITSGQLSLARGGTGIDASGVTSGQLLIGNNTGGFNLSTLTAGSGITIDSTGTPGHITIAQTGSGASKFTENDAQGVLYPNISTLDVLFGGTASNSAKFAFLNNAGSGTPTASISGTTANTYAYLDGNGNLATTNKQTLTLGAASTGNIAIGTDATARTLSLGNSTGASAVNITAGSGGIGLTGATNINTSGTANTTIGNTSGGTITIGATSGSDLVLQDANWGVTGAGAGTFASLSDGGNLAFTGANPSITNTGSNTLTINSGSTGNIQFFSSSNTLSNSGALTLAGGITAATSSTINGININSGTISNATWNGTTIGVQYGGTGANLSAGGSIGDLLYADSATTFARLAPSTSGRLLETQGAGSAPIWVDAASVGTNYWSRVAGVLSPVTANDVIAATSSATTVGTFTSNNPAGTLTNNTLIQQTGAGTVTNLLNLTQSAGTVTNAISLSGTFGSALKVGSNTILNGTGVLQSAGLSGTYSQALTLSSASNAFTGTYNGNTITTGTGTLTLGAGKTLTANNTITLAGTDGKTLTLNNDTTLNASSIVLGGNTYTFPGTSGNVCLNTNNCGYALGQNYWQLNSGAISPVFPSADLLLGGTSTASAKFAFINNVTGTPIASISAQSGNNSALVLGADSTIQSVRNQTLTLGGNTTGDIAFRPGGVSAGSSLYLASSGNVGINTNVPAQALTVGGGIAIDSNGNNNGFLDLNGAQGYGLSFGGLATGEGIASNRNSGNQFGLDFYTNYVNRLSITNGGNIGINTTTPTARLDVNGTASISGQLALYGTPQIQSTANQTLILGGSTTGDIAFRPGGVTAGNSLYLASSGNVGIGVTNPSTALDLKGTLTVRDSADTTNLFQVVNSNHGTNFPRTLFEGGNSTGDASGNWLMRFADAYSSSSLNIAAGFQISTNNDPNYINTNSVLMEMTSTKAVFFTIDHSSLDGQPIMLSTSANINYTTPNLYLDTVGNANAVGIGTVTPNAQLDVEGITGTGSIGLFNGTTSHAALSVNQSGVGDLFTASASGTTKFVIKNDGSIAFGSTYNNCGMLTTTGTVLTCSSTPAGSTNYWQLNGPVLSPGNLTTDLTLGGTSTASAKFAFINVNSGTPTASISAQSGNNSALVLGADSTIQSVRNQTLTLGGSTTGDIAFNPGNVGVGSSLYLASNGKVGIGTNVPGSNLQVNGTTTVGNTNSAGAFTVKNSGGSTLFNVDTSGNGVYLQTPQNASVGTQTVNSATLNLTGAYWNGSSSTSLNYTLQNVVSSTAPAYRLAFINNSSQEKMTLDSNGNLGIGSTAPIATLDVRGTNGTSPVASISGATTFANTVIDQSGTGDLFTASKSGATKFVINNAGNVGIGTATPSAELEVVGRDQSSVSTSFAVYDNNQNRTALATVKNDGEVGLGKADATFGNTSSGNFTGSGYNDTGSGVLLQAQSFTTTSGGAIKSMSTYIGSGVSATNKSYQFGIYSDSGGGSSSTPNALIASSSVGTLSGTGWNTLPISATLSPSTKYWLVYWTNVTDGTNNSQNFVNSYTGPNTFYQGHQAWGSGTMPSTFPTGTGPSSSFETSIYASFVTPISALTLDSSGNLTENGNALFQPIADGASAFQIKNSTGTQIFGLDTALGRAELNCGALTTYNFAVCGTLALDSNDANAILLTTTNGQHVFNVNSLTGASTFGNITSTAGQGLAGSLVLADGTADNFGGTISTTTLTANRTYTLPDASGTLCLSSNNCGYALGQNYWQQSSGALSPVISTLDLLLGGNSTASADFAFTGVDSTNPTASISAFTNSGNKNGISLSSNNATIQALNMNTLTLGGATTGDIAFQPGGQTVGNSLYLASNANVGIGTAAPGASLDIQENAATTGTIVNISGTGLTTGTGLAITGGSSMATGGVLENINMGAATAGNGLTIASTGVYTGTGLQTITANSATTGTIESISGTGLTTGTAAVINVNGTNTLTSGQALQINGPTGAAAISNNSGLLKIVTSGALTGTSGSGTHLDIIGNGTLTATLASISDSSVMTGNGQLLSLTAGAATTTTKGLLNVNGAGLTTGYAEVLNANGAAVLTSGGALSVVGPTGAAAISANSGLVKISATGALTTQTGAGSGGLLDVQDNAIITGTLASISDTAVMTTTGNLLTLTANSATTATGIETINATGLTTGWALDINAPNSLSTTGKIGVNTATALAALDVRGVNATQPAASISANTNFASLVVDNTGTGDIFTASKSGATKFVIKNNGDTQENGNLIIADPTGNRNASLTFDGLDLGGNTFQLYSAGGGLNFYGNTQDVGAMSGSTGAFSIGAGNVTPTAQFDALASDFTLPGGYFHGSTGKAMLEVNQLSNAGDLFTASNSGTPKFTITNAGGIKLGTSEGTSGQCLESGGAGAAATWTTCSGGTNFWQLNSGAISPFSNSADLLIGGTATTSANFAFINNVGAGTPTASISARSGNNATYLTGAGVLGTTNAQTLTLGSASTGNITIAPANTLAIQAANNSTNTLNLLNVASDQLLNANTTTTNLVSNPGFESGTTNWSPSGSSTLTQSTIPSTYYYGSASLKVALAASGTSGATTSTFTSSLGANTYVISFYAKASATLSGLAVSLGSGTCTLSSTNSSATQVSTSWNLYYCTVTTTGAPTLTITSTTNSQNLYLDAVQLQTTIQSNIIAPYSAGILSTIGQLVVNSNSNQPQNGNQPFAEQINSFEDPTATGGGGLLINGTTDNIFQNALVVSDTGGNVDFNVNTAAAQTVISGGSNFFNTSAMQITSRANLAQALNVTGAAGALVSTASVSAQSTFAAMVVDNSGTGDIFTASKSGATKFTVKNSGTVVIGNSTNGITFDPTGSTTAIYTGTARPTKQIILSPEYAGAVLTASASAYPNGSNGFMTSDASPSATPTTYNFENYYQWLSTQTSNAQTYVVAVRVTLPKDFSDWSQTTPIQVDYNTSTNTTSNAQFNLFIYNPTASSTTPVVYHQALVSGGPWKTDSTTYNELTAGTNKWNTAGQTAVFYMTMQAQNSAYVQVGDIKLNYLAQF